MSFANPFDAALAAHGPPAVFLFDREGLLRFDETWSRDAWGRHEGPHERAETWALLRDHDTGFVHLVMATSPTLIDDHPRFDVRLCGSRAEAEAARSRMGAPPIDRTPWS